MLSFESATGPILYGVGALMLVVLWALVVYRMEMRRAGSNVWSEWHNDRVVPLARASRGARRSGRGGGTAPAR